MERPFPFTTSSSSYACFLNTSTKTDPVNVCFFCVYGRSDLEYAHKHTTRKQSRKKSINESKRKKQTNPKKIAQSLCVSMHPTPFIDYFPSYHDSIEMPCELHIGAYIIVMPIQQHILYIGAIVAYGYLRLLEFFVNSDK